MGAVLALITAELLCLPYRLWGERWSRRMLHHIQHLTYDPRVPPVLHVVRGAMPPDIVAQARTLTRLDKRSTPTWIQRLTSTKGGRLPTYHNERDVAEQRRADKVGASLIGALERIIHRPMRLSNTNFRSVVLDYAGTQSFPWHYDTEKPSCWRSLTLIERKGVPGRLFFRDGDRDVPVDLQVGDTVLFKGTCTYHCVRASADPTSRRVIFGAQFEPVGDQSVEAPSLCSEFRHRSIPDIVCTLFLPIIVFCNVLTWFCTTTTTISWFAPAYIRLLAHGLCAAGALLGPLLYLPSEVVGTGNLNDVLGVARTVFFCSLTCLHNPEVGVWFAWWLLWSDMLAPRLLVRYRSTRQQAALAAAAAAARVRAKESSKVGGLVRGDGIGDGSSGGVAEKLTGGTKIGTKLD